MKVIILQGCSGSGKSSYAESLRKTNPDMRVDILSADHFFMVDGEYKFDASKLDYAHGSCMRNYLYVTGDEEIHRNINYLIIDNTNTTPVEIAPYYAVASALGIEVEIVHIDTPWAAAAARNKHGVPEAVVRAQSERIRTNQFPKRWNRRKVSLNE